MPVVCHRLISSYLIFLTRYSSFPELQSTANQFSLCAGFRCLCLSALDVSVLRLMLSHNNRNVSGEWVFCYQGAYPFLPKEKTGGDFCVPSPVSSLRAKIVTLFIKFFYKFSSSSSLSSYSTITPNSSNAIEISDNAENCCSSFTIFCCSS